MFSAIDTKLVRAQAIIWRMRQTEKYLADAMNEVQPVWDNRGGDHNSLPHLFSSDVTGSIDTFPVYVARPKNSWWQKKLYNGKYGNAHFIRLSIAFDEFFAH